MYLDKGPVPTDDYTIPFGQADIKREGDDMTFVATSSMVNLALEAADQLAIEGINAEVIDPRTLFPLDVETLVTSVRKTGFCVVVDEGASRYGVTGELASTIGYEAFDYLDAPVARIGAADVPVPFSPSLELPTIPDTTRLIEVAKSLRS